MENSLAKKCKELSKEWSDRNLPLVPETVSYGSNKKVWWRGRCGHEWEASVKNRVHGSGCPYCSHNLILEGFNDFASQFPTLRTEWSDRNQMLKPQDVMAFSNKKVWWKCVKGHEWEARISDRAYGSRCPYCTGHILASGINDLETCRPELAKEWSERNLPLLSNMVSEKSRQNVWWKCSDCGYEWKAVIWPRVKGSACPVCADKTVVTGINDLTTTDKELLQDWDYERNREVRPTAVSRKSMRSVWWKCGYGHQWKARISDRVFDGKCCAVCEAEYASVFPQLALAYYARKIGQKVEFESDKEIGLTFNAYFPEEKLAFVWDNKGSTYRDTMEYLCRKRGIKLVRVKSKTSTIEIAEEIKRAFHGVHVFIASEVEEDESFIRKQFEDWRRKNRL